MGNTLQVDGLARILGLTPAPYKAHPQPPNGVPSCLVGRIGFGRGERLTIWWRIPTETRTARQLTILNTHGYTQAHILKSTKQN